MYLFFYSTAWLQAIVKIYYSELLVEIFIFLLIYLSIYILMKVWSPWLIVRMIDCMFEAVRTNPGYGMFTLIHNFWDFWELLFVFARKLGWNFMHPKPYLRFWIFEIKYYNNIRANFLSYFTVNFYFITIIHYLNKQD